MTIERSLDVTPPFTMSTIQFRSETLNVIVASLLAVFILANIGSAVSKLVSLQYTKTKFSYNAWVRAFVFANSDDPIRLLSWLRRRYEYYDPKWTRAKNRLRPSRLVTPLLARFVVLLASIASIAVTIPGEKKLSGCEKGDFQLVADPAQAVFTTISTSVCVPIELETRLGTVRSSATYCTCDVFNNLGDAALPRGWAVLFVGRDVEVGMVSVVIAALDQAYGFGSYVEWQGKNNRVVYRSKVDFVNLDLLMQAAVQGLLHEKPRCIQGERHDVQFDDEATEGFGYLFTNCGFVDNARNSDHVRVNAVIESFVRNALTLNKTEQIQNRLQIQKDTAQFDTISNKCVVDVTVTRPVVNIVPLALTLVLWFIINLIITRIVSKHGNALDTAFHIIKESLGHDCTSNPLEESVNSHVSELQLYKWTCASSRGGHVGFLGREGDVPVDEFPDNIVVGGCAKAAAELTVATTLANAAAAPASPQQGPATSSVITAPVGGTPGGGTPVQSPGTPSGWGAGGRFRSDLSGGQAAQTQGQMYTPGASQNFTPGASQNLTPGVSQNLLPPGVSQTYAVGVNYSPVQGQPAPPYVPRGGDSAARGGGQGAV